MLAVAPRCSSSSVTCVPGSLSSIAGQYCLLTTCDTAKYHQGKIQSGLQFSFAMQFAGCNLACSSTNVQSFVSHMRAWVAELNLRAVLFVDCERNKTIPFDELAIETYRIDSMLARSRNTRSITCMPAFLRTIPGLCREQNHVSQVLLTQCLAG